jgi:hypothetical protein
MERLGNPSQPPRASRLRGWLLGYEAEVSDVAEEFATL